MTIDYQELRGRHEERVARSLAAFAAPRAAGRDCPLERLAKRIVARRRRRLDAALLAR